MALPFSSNSTIQQTFKFTMAKAGPNAARQNAPHPHSTFTEPTGKFLISCDLGADLVRIFAIDAETGNLTACPAMATAPGDGPRHGAFWSPNNGTNTTGMMLYTVNELGNSVTTWTMNYPEDGGCLNLTRLASISNLGPGKAVPAGTKSAEVHVLGNFAYASNRNDQTYGSKMDSIATYSIDPASGNLTFLALDNAHSWFPRTFAINNAGTMVAMGGQTSSNIAILARNTTTGLLGGLIASLNVGTPGTPELDNGLSAVVWWE